MEVCMYYYKTFYKPTREAQIQYTVDMLYQGIVPASIYNYNAPPEKITIRKESKETFSINQPIYNALINVLEQVNDELDYSYTDYRIPKSSGGFRIISAPNEQLKTLQRTVVNLLERLNATAHDAAYAYTAQRTCKDAIIKHQRAENNWFYKFDIKDFFPSCTVTVLKNNLKFIYPFCCLPNAALDKIIKLATRNGALPQGSPLSPLLSNVLLMPFDFMMTFSMRPFKGVYTRYADDIIISTAHKHQLDFIQRIIKSHLQEISPDLKINTEKSRCGSIKGSNWNLGLMLNADNNITIGHKKKMELKAKINNFIFDFTNRNYWSIIDTQVLQGELNYFKTIEPEYAVFVIQRLEQKHNTTRTLAEMFSDIISGRV